MERESKAPRERDWVSRLFLQATGTAVVAMFAYATATRLPSLREAYWAPIAAAIVLYPERQATVKAGAQRLLGTAVGSLVGWASAAGWQGHVGLYGVAVFVAVSFCYLVRWQDASRLCAVAVTVITLIPHHEPAVQVALMRFLVVAYGVGCAVLYMLAIDWIRRRLQRARGRA
jgi:uncharacterized membrane protein YgaE (UPF0421/DUF939 family)